jgi:hypothetical protein
MVSELLSAGDVSTEQGAHRYSRRRSSTYRERRLV